MALGTQPTVAADFYTAFTSYNALCEQILTRPAAQALRDADGEAVEAEPWRRQGKDNALGAGWAVPMLAFARLKNWHGVERAFLCGVLALPDDAVASLPSRASRGSSTRLTLHASSILSLRSVCEATPWD